MSKLAVIKTGGKQYLVKENDEIVVDSVPHKVDDKFDVELVAAFDGDSSVELGMPALSKMASAQVVSHIKGDKVRVAKFKAKVRYRKVRGYRASLSKIKILSI